MFNFSMLYKNKMIYTLNVKLLIVLLFFIILYFLSYFIFISPKLENYLVSNEKAYYTNELNRMTNLIELHGQYLEEYKQDLLKNKRNHLSKIESLIDNLINTKYAHCKKEKDLCLEETYNYINKINNKNDFYTNLAFVSKEGFILKHKNKSYIGKNISNFIKNLPKEEELKEGFFINFMHKNIKKLAFMKFSSSLDIHIILADNFSSIKAKLENKKLFEINRIKNLIEKSNTKEPTSIFIFDKKQTLFYPKEDFYNKDIFYKNLKDAYLKKENFEYQVNDKIKNKPYSKIAWVNYNKTFDWYILTSIKKDKLTEKYKRLNNNILLMSIFAFLIIFLITIYITSRITKPLKDLIENIHTFQKKNYDESSYIKINSKDEFELVSDNFNKMKKDILNNITYLENEISIRTMELEHKLYYDELTKLKNRHSLINILNEEEFASILLIDINKFGEINELYGYRTGSMVIQEFVKNLLKFSKKYDFELFKVDGVTFAFLKVGTLRFTPFIKDINKLLQRMSNLPIYIEEIKDNIFLNTTVGISLCHEYPLKSAFSALNKAKREKLNYCLFNNTIDEKELIEKNLYWNKKIKYAILNKNIIPYFQAIVNKKGEIIKYETLIRMKDEDENKIISPYFFLEISKKTKQYSTLSYLIISKALKKIQKDEVELSINMSYSDTQDRNIIKLLDTKLSNEKIAKKLTIEILEDDEIKDYKELKKFLDKYKELGVKFAIDDFGAGYSNILNILELNPDYLKIDASLIKNIDTDLASYNIVKSIIDFSKNMNIKIIAEFVHNQIVFEKLKELDIYAYQGYYFAEPQAYTLKDDDYSYKIK